MLILNHPSGRRAFSLMELLAVVTILGIIAAVIVPRVTSSSDAAKDKVCRHNIGQINAAIERFYINNGRWPDEDLYFDLHHPEYFPDGLPVCPVTGEEYTAPEGERVEHDPDLVH